MEKPSPCDVLVVGAGPTGLLMACQLARHGVRFRIIDDRTDRAHESRAFEGATYPSEFVLADVRMPLDAPLAFYLTGRAIMLVGAIGELVRVMGVAFDEPPTDAPVSIDEINALARAAQAPFHIERAEWM